MLQNALEKARTTYTRVCRATISIITQHTDNMSLEASPEPPQRSPKRKRAHSSSGLNTPRYDGDGADDPDAKLSYSYDDDEDLGSDAENAFNTPDQGSDDEAASPKRRRRRRRAERPTRLNYVPHMTLRGHKRGVASVKFSPDGKWIASCCKD